MKRIGIVLLAVFFSVFQTEAREAKGVKRKSGPTPNSGIAANCSPATAAAELSINNTRALIQSGGDMWWDFNASRYEIPQGSGRTSLFAGSLWLGGQDVAGQLKVAALRFRQVGNDYWTGPLSTVTSEISAETCRDYDRHFASTRDDVTTFVAWFNAGVADAEDGTNTQQEDFPGYQRPRIIDEWPAHGRNFDPFNEDFNLAPFIDINGDGFYNPNDGDYPAYDLTGEADCRQKVVNLFGDENLWWVFNDKGNIHTETGGEAIGMEIRAQAFAFATNDEVNNMTFYNYELINRSTFTLTETFFGQWVDGDLGCAQDDYVGCDVQRGLGYFFNGFAIDADCGGQLGYGENPPAIGIDFFQGPFQDNDGLDNPGPTSENGFQVTFE
ncbi:MAG: T9SS C-terminal target domain-containing protein, partial [Bacteroidota bacterium]